MDRRTEILEAATKSFSLFGYKATTVDQVAKIANVGKGTIYTFFDTKEQLLEHAVLNMVGEMKVEADYTIDPTLSFSKNAHNALIRMLQFRDRHLLFAKLIEEEKEIQTPAVKQMLLRIEDEIVSYIANRIQVGIEKNEIHLCNTTHVAYLLLKAYKAFIFEWPIMHGEQLNEDQILMLFKLTIFNGLAKN